MGGCGCGRASAFGKDMGSRSAAFDHDAALPDGGYRAQKAEEPGANGVISRQNKSKSREAILKSSEVFAGFYDAGYCINKKEKNSADEIR